MGRCDHCRNLDFKMNLEEGKKLEYRCTKGMHNLSQIEKIEDFEVKCEAFDSRYIEYPLEISGIDLPEGRGIRAETYRRAKTGSLVAVRPCGEKYGDKTYIGIYLGDADIGLHVSFNRESKRLSINRHYNPAMFVPDLGEIIYGCGSWWKLIESEEEVKAITDDDIQGVWYVKALKGLSKTETTTETA